MLLSLRKLDIREFQLSTAIENFSSSKTATEKILYENLKKFK